MMPKSTATLSTLGSNDEVDREIPRKNDVLSLIGVREEEIGSIRLLVDLHPGNVYFRQQVRDFGLKFAPSNKVPTAR